jgi:hypothetical protein
MSRRIQIGLPYIGGVVMSILSSRKVNTKTQKKETYLAGVNQDAGAARSHEIRVRPLQLHAAWVPA